MGVVMSESTIKCKFWLEKEGKILFGPGGAVLLDKIHSTGSLSAASKELGMSYRAAWGRLKRLEENLGQALVMKLGGNKSGYCLTELGKQFVSSYYKAEEIKNKAEKEMMETCFNWY